MSKLFYSSYYIFSFITALWMHSKLCFSCDLCLWRPAFSVAGRKDSCWYRMCSGCGMCLGWYGNSIRTNYIAVKHIDTWKLDCSWRNRIHKLNNTLIFKLERKNYDSCSYAFLFISPFFLPLLQQRCRVAITLKQQPQCESYYWQHDLSSSLRPWHYLVFHFSAQCPLSPLLPRLHLRPCLALCRSHCTAPSTSGFWQTGCCLHGSDADMGRNLKQNHVSKSGHGEQLSVPSAAVPEKLYW